MKVFADQLPAALAKHRPKAVIVSGDEPLQHRDACDAVREDARARGAEERNVIDIDASSGWQALFETAGNLSLFATSRLVEIRLGQHKLGQEGTKALADYAAQLEKSDDILLLSMAKLDARQQKSAWFKALDKQGLFVPVWPVDVSRLGFWVRDRGALHGLQLDMDAARLLGERTEGNLLAADQALQKLALTVGSKTRIDIEQVAQGVDDSSRFDVFNLADACLKADVVRTSRIITGLRGEGMEAPIVLWALTREIRTLLSIHQHLDQGQSFEHACKAQKPMIFDKRRPAYQNALKRLPMKRLHKLLLMAQRLDMAVKGAGSLPVWPALHDLAVTLAGGRGLLAETAWTYKVQ